MTDYRNTCSSLVKQINDNLEKSPNNTLRAGDLTMSQIGVLIALDHAAAGTMAMKELKDSFGVSQPTMFGIVKRLSQKEWVVCFDNPADRRLKMVQLTDAGKEKCRFGYVHMEGAEEELLHALDDKERLEFRRLLEKIRASM